MVELVAGAEHLDEARFLLPVAFAVDVLAAGPADAAVDVGGAAGLELGAHDFAVAVRSVAAHEQHIGKREEDQRAEDEKAGVPKIEPQAEAHADALKKGKAPAAAADGPAAESTAEGAERRSSRGRA